MSGALAISDRTVLSPEARLRGLCDPKTLRIIRSSVLSRDMGDRALAGDGVLAATGLVNGSPVACYAHDPSYAGGSLGASGADTITRILRLARRGGIPVVGFVESAGARMQEGVAALGGYGRVFDEIVRLSKQVPQISVITGPAAGGGAYASALTDWVIMTGDAAMFLTGPAVVREAIGEDVSAAALGGPRVHSRNGVCHFVAADDSEAIKLARELLAYLPRNARREPRALAPQPPQGDGNVGALVPAESRRVYDVRRVIAAIADGGGLLEVTARWARNMVTGFCRLDGRPVGVVANQPRYLGGVIDIAASQKAARFVHDCDAFNVPLVVLVDTTGFLPGSRQEAGGVIRQGSELIRAFSSASVARVTVVLRKAYGGAYITMNSKDLGAHFTFAWPDAEIGVMSARSAVGIINRRHLEFAVDRDHEERRLAAIYAMENVSAVAAARRGFIDEVIKPEETRDWLISSLAMVHASASDATAEAVP
jgi:acetyl-CoA carboxylase carboxyltransferase component